MPHVAGARIHASSARLVWDVARLAVRVVRLRRAGELAASRAEALGASVWAARDA